MPTRTSSSRRPRGRLGLLAASVVLLSVGCGLAWLTYPPDLPARRTDFVSELGGPEEAVEVLVDDRGIPHIFASHERDLSFALGFLHARDRQFQILVLKHLAQGRLTELFGEELIGTDLTYRLLTYRLDDQVAALDPRDRALLEAYLEGLNKGAAHAGRTAEMRVLGAEWEPFTLRDALSLIRLQTWGLSFDARQELARSRVLARLPEGDPRRAALLAPTPTGNVPVFLPGSQVQVEGGPGRGQSPSRYQLPDAGPAPEPLVVPVQRQDGGTAEEPIPLENIPPPASDAEAPPGAQGPATDREALVAWAKELAQTFGPQGKGASNAWAVHGSRTADGVPVLCNDPHLRHLAPSLMYLVHLETPELLAVGATLPGIPGVVIGHTRHLAWGLTTSYADTQDLVEIEEAPGDDTRYLLDGQPRAFGRWTHRFIDDNDDVLLAQTWRTTVFGPVLPEAWDHLKEPASTYALMWTGQEPELNATNLSGFWDLYAARDLVEARAALEKIGSPSQNVTLAFKDGTIAYHLMGAIPRRRSRAPTDRPRDGRSSDASWAGVLSGVEKPALENPPLGYIVTANQRVVEVTGPAASSLGVSAAPPHRAIRIHQRVRKLLASGDPVTPDALLDIQHDAVSPEALQLAPLLARVCPETLEGFEEATVKAFCQELAGFDGHYSTLSRGALPFTWLLEELQTEILASHLGTDVALQLRSDAATQGAIAQAIVDDAAGKEPPLLDDRRTPEREGLRGFMLRALVSTLERLADEAGSEPADWRWGRHHILQPQGPLASAPLIGGSFELPWRAQAGWGSTPRAENGLPIRTGAVLRMVARMSDPPEVRFTLDLGQSGHFGHPHMADMRTDWDLGRPRAIPLEKELIPLESHLRFLPAGTTPPPRAP